MVLTCFNNNNTDSASRPEGVNVARIKAGGRLFETIYADKFGITNDHRNSNPYPDLNPYIISHISFNSVETTPDDISVFVDRG